MKRINQEHDDSDVLQVKRQNVQKKRKIEERTFTIISVILYSVFLLFVVIASYVGIKLFITSKKNATVQEQVTLEEVVEEQVEEDDNSSENEPEEEEEIVTEEPEEDEDADKVWQDKVFSRLENPNNSGQALINTYDFTRLCAQNDSGHTMDYLVYSIKDTGKVEKITTCENCGDMFETIDYYYDDGKINYIAQYSQDINIPINISTADVNSRYYFRDDELVKYIYCENDKATEYSLKDLSSYSEGTKGQYEYMENMMLEKSEYVWKEIKNLKNTVNIDGYILDEFNQVLTDNYVILVDENNKIVDETHTNGDGFYSFTVNASDAKEYSIRASRDTLEDTIIYGIKPYSGSKQINAPTMYMAYSNNTFPFQTQVFVKDADTSEDLAYADIKFRYGLNARYGDSFLAGNLGEYGYISPQLRSGCYTAEVTRDGYEKLFFNFVVKTDHQAVVAFATKELSEGEIKAVLSWEANPLDLNFRCITSNQGNSFISARNSVGSTDAEVIDILLSGEDTYCFYVSDLTNIAINNYVSYSMFESDAKIALYDENGLIGNYPVPAAHGGVVWKPFEVRNHQVMFTNDFYSSLDNNSVFKKR